MNEYRKLSQKYQNRRQKLTAQDREQIKSLHATGKYTYERLGSKFNVSLQRISEIVKGK
jgi:hypothetical protein